jgi:hypothetical protein
MRKSAYRKVERGAEEWNGWHQHTHNIMFFFVFVFSFVASERTKVNDGEPSSTTIVRVVV